MTKHLGKIKATIIMGVLLGSLIVATMPTTSAGTFIRLNSYVDISWDNISEEPLVPRQDQVELGLDVRYGVTCGPIFAKSLLKLYVGSQVEIKLDIIEEETTEWVSANLKSSTITTMIKDEEDEYSSSLTLSIARDAPAFEPGIITIKTTIDKVGPIDGFSQKFTLRFRPDYLPLLSYSTPETNSKTAGPMDTVQFPIEVTNKGNDRTTVQLEIEYIPEGWLAVVTDEITIDKEETGTVYLTVKPPKSFGYHDDRASIRVKMTPAFAEDLQQKGDPRYATFIVESRGISSVGIEIVLLPLIVIIVLLVVVIYIFSKRRGIKK
jgi:uncharacterized membrane protein